MDVGTSHSGCSRLDPERSLSPGRECGVPGAELSVGGAGDWDGWRGENGRALGHCVAGSSISQPAPHSPDIQLPIMDWQALEQHIAGLQQIETERQAREGPRPQPPHPPASPVGRRRAEGMQRLVSWPRADSTAWRAMGETMGCASRFHNRMNLQLCFINDSSSESDPEDEGQRSPADPAPQGSALTGCRGELEREARRGLALVRRQLEQERQRHRESSCTGPFPGVDGGRSLERGELLDTSPTRLRQLRDGILSQIHHFNSQLMELLECRDDLKTEQDAMLIEIGDLTH